MLQFVARLLGKQTRPARAPRASAVPRRARLGLEGLESRALLSASPLTPLSHVTPQANSLVAQVAQADHLAQVIGSESQVGSRFVVRKVPNLAGVSFHLLADDGVHPAHDLVIQAEAYRVNGSATFTGTWKGDNNPNAVPKPITGTLSYDAQGDLKIDFSWTNGSGGQNSFDGTITVVPNRYGNLVFGSHYHLHGAVKATGDGTGPGSLTGDGGFLLPVLNKL